MKHILFFLSTIMITSCSFGQDNSWNQDSSASNKNAIKSVENTNISSVEEQKILNF